MISGFWKSVAVMMIVTLITAVMHLIEIALWAIVFLLCGEIATFETAFYFSAENYTVHWVTGTSSCRGGGGSSARWKVINGLLLIGLSTAGMFAVLNRLITNRLRRQA